MNDISISGLNNNFFNRIKEEKLNINELITLANNELSSNLREINPIWGDLLSRLLRDEPELFWKREVEELIFSSLGNLHNENSSAFEAAMIKALPCFFSGTIATFSIAESFRKLEHVKYRNDIKTRLFRIPAYIQLLEACLSNLFRFLRDLIGGMKNIDIEQQNNLSNLKDFLSSRSFGILFDAVDVNVRNSVSHGTFFVSSTEVHFTYLQGKSKARKSKTWTTRDAIGEAVISMAGAKNPHFDDFIEEVLDTATGIIMGLIHYLLKNRDISNLIEREAKTNHILHEYLMQQKLSFPGNQCLYFDSDLVNASQINAHFWTNEKDTGKIFQLSLNMALILRVEFKSYASYMIGFKGDRMLSGWVLYRSDELDSVLNGIQECDIMAKNVYNNNRVLLWEPSTEDIDINTLDVFKFPDIDGDDWRIREITEASVEKIKRLRANLYIFSQISHEAVCDAVTEAIESLKNIENPPSPKTNIKWGAIPCDAIYLFVYHRRGRRRERIISSQNNNFVCVVEWHIPQINDLIEGGLPEVVWESLRKERHGDLLFAWNPIFEHSPDDQTEE